MEDYLPPRNTNLLEGPETQNKTISCIAYRVYPSRIVYTRGAENFSKILKQQNGATK
jgi:hypothetical protein